MWWPITCTAALVWYHAFWHNNSKTTTKQWIGAYNWLPNTVYKFSQQVYMHEEIHFWRKKLEGGGGGETADSLRQLKKIIL